MAKRASWIDTVDDPFYMPPDPRSRVERMREAWAHREVMLARVAELMTPNDFAEYVRKVDSDLWPMWEFIFTHPHAKNLRHGMDIPKEALDAIRNCPDARQAEVLAVGLMTMLDGLAAENPKLSRTLEVAKQQREAGELLAEDAREKRASKIGPEIEERQRWLRTHYDRVRDGFPAGNRGDKQARAEVIAKYRKAFGPTLTDRMVRRDLQAMRK